MSIKSFLDSAIILYDKKKYYEALCLACISVDACASKHYSHISKKSSERYKLFLKNNFSIICKYGFPGIQASNIRIKVNVPNINLKPDKNGYVDMEQIIYYVLRCGLVHECNIEKTIKFTNQTILGDWGDVFYIHENIIYGLIESVKNNIS